MKKNKKIKFALISLIIIAAIMVMNPTRSTTQIKNINIARSTGETGWFQTEVVKQLLEKLEYQVSQPQTKDNLDFYAEVATGKIDLWVNGWFPLHNPFLKLEGVKGKVETVGYLIKGGGIQGYLIDAKSVNKFKINNISDLKDPEIAKQFDRNNNGKADLIGCEKEWACADTIDYQIEKYGLKDTVEQIKGNYNIAVRKTISNYQQGKPILFYTWTPNWTIDTLKPGKDLVWLEVPFSALPEQQQIASKTISVSQLEGCKNDPCKLGFPINDIKAVTNKQFLDSNPDVKKLLELIKIPLEDINQANAKFFGGKDSEEALKLSAAEWIENNHDKVNLWLKLARDERITKTNLEQKSTTQIINNQAAPTLKVVTKRFEPFVIYENGKYEGFSIDLWKQLAVEMGINYEIYGVNSIANLLDRVRRNSADVGMAGITITAQREQTLDFSHPFYETGLQIMVANQDRSILETIGSSIWSVLRSIELYYGLGIFMLILLAIAHGIWWFERDRNPEFPQSYLQGIWESLWWVAVTLTTVGYGDKTPKTPKGRLLGLFWMFAGYFVFAYFTATITTTFAVERLEGRISGFQDLNRVRVGTVAESAAQEFLEQENIYPLQYDSLEETYLALKDRKIEAIVYDAGTLQYYALQEGRGSVQLVGSIFKKQYYGIALPQDSPYRNKINVALLKIQEDGSYDRIYQKWFGNEIR